MFVTKTVLARQPKSEFGFNKNHGKRIIKTHKVKTRKHAGPNVYFVRLTHKINLKFIIYTDYCFKKIEISG